jgi:hypothetical protein
MTKSEIAVQIFLYRRAGDTEICLKPVGRGPLNMVMNLLLLQMVGNCSNSRATVVLTKESALEA